MHCVSEPFTVGLFLVECNAINESPPYQREGAVWSPEKQQLLLDRLMQQGTNDLTSLQNRVSILRRFFLQRHPDVELRDKTRSFTDEERLAIWILGGKQCAMCRTLLPDIDDMLADHHLQWSHGGATNLKNGRSLCANCNQSEAQRVA